MKKNKFMVVLLLVSFLLTSFHIPPVNNSNLAEYEVRFTFIGYTSFYGGRENCRLNDTGKVILSGILKGDENVGSDDPVLYIGVLQISINIDICSAKREDGEDKFCTMTVKGSGPVKTELEIDASAGYGYIKIKYDSTLGQFKRSVNGTCDQAQLIEEQKMVPNETIAAIFNGKELPMLTDRTLRKRLYPSDKSAEGETVVEVLQKVH